MLSALGFKLDEGIVKRLEKIKKFSSQAKGSIELIIDYLLMKRALLSSKVKLSNKKYNRNELTILLNPSISQNEEEILPPEEDYDFLMVDEEARVTLSRKIYDMCNKIGNISKIIKKGYGDMLDYIEFSLEHDELEHYKEHLQINGKKDLIIYERLVFLRLCREEISGNIKKSIQLMDMI